MADSNSNSYGIRVPKYNGKGGPHFTMFKMKFKAYLAEKKLAEILLTISCFHNIMFCILAPWTLCHHFMHFCSWVLTWADKAYHVITRLCIGVF